MGMGSFAVQSFVIEYDDLKKLCPKEIKAIENAEYFDWVGWGVMGQWLGWSDDDQIMDSLHDAVLDNKSDNTIDEINVVENIFDQYEQLVTNLKTAFHQKTGLNLEFDYYDEDSGGRYDCPGDKDGCVFCVHGMVQLTPAGEKFKDIITERRWTQFG